MPYYQQVLSPEEVAGQDPFGGRGVQVALDPGQSRDDVIERMEREYPGRGWVIFDSCAWVEAEDQTIT